MRVCLSKRLQNLERASWELEMTLSQVIVAFETLAPQVHEVARRFSSNHHAARVLMIRHKLNIQSSLSL